MRDLCGDCGCSDPNWASLNRGILLCDECCSIHRNIGRHVSWVRSLHQNWWSPSLLMMVEQLSKTGANSIWEYNLLDQTSSTVSCKPSPADPLHSTKEGFIREKHEDLEFILRSDQSPDGPDGLGAQLHSAARTTDLITTLRLFSQGADPNFYHEDKGSYPLHVAARAGQSLQVELLLIYGAQVDKKDVNGKTAEEVAAEAGHVVLAARLKNHRYHVVDRLVQYLYSRKPGQTAVDLNFLSKNIFFGVENDERMRQGRQRLFELTNGQFERLVADIYDEVDRREAEAAWSATTKSEKSSVATPFLPVHPDLSSTRNQGRQKLARLSSRDFNALITDILSECRRRDTSVSSQEMGQYPIYSSPPSAVQQAKMLTEISDEEPLYDSVASDEDYASVEKLNNKLNEGDLRSSLASSQATIVQLKTEIKLLQDKVSGLVKENDMLRNQSFVSEERVSRGSSRPISMYEARDVLRNRPPPKTELSQSASTSSAQLNLPTTLEVMPRITQVTQNLQQLQTAMKENDLNSFVPCAERIRLSVIDMTQLFPKGTADELLSEISTNVVRLRVECISVQDYRIMIPEALQRIRYCAFNIAKVAKALVLLCDNKNC